MTSRERVKIAINHKEPDRVPIDIGSMRSTGIEATAYKRLREYLNINDRPIKLYDVWQQLTWTDEDILEYFHADVRSIERIYSAWWNPEIKLDKWKEGELTDGTKAEVPKGFSPVKEGKFYVIKNKKGEIVAKRSENGLYYDQVGVYHPLREAKNTTELKKQYKDLFPEGQDIASEEQDHLRAQSNKLRKNTEGVETIRVSDEINVDISPDGKIYGIELLNANEQLPIMKGSKFILADESTGKTRQFPISAE